MYQITSQLNARSDSLQQLREATQADDTLAILKYIIEQGCPSSIKDLPSEIQPFWTFREESTIEDGLILKGTDTSFFLFILKVLKLVKFYCVIKFQILKVSG